MHRFHPVFTFLRVRNQPQVFELMVSDMVEDLLIDQGDYGNRASLVALGHKVILFVTDNKGRGFIRLMPLDGGFGRIQVFQQLLVLLIRAFRQRRFKGVCLLGPVIDPHQHGDMPVSLLQALSIC
ncbi:hypothetical protein D3C73_1325640 [compost metagenome]